MDLCQFYAYFKSKKSCIIQFKLTRCFFLFSFTKILGDKRYSTEESEEPTRKSPRFSNSEQERALELLPNGLFSNLCQLCGKYRKQRDKKKYEPYKITTKNSEAAIKSTAKSKNEPMYCKIAHLDIIAKEFKVHNPYYKSFTLDHYRENKQDNSDPRSIPQEGEASTYSTSNYEEVKEYVNDIIINEKKPATMKLLHEIYGLEIDNSSYRNKLKKRFEKDFGDNIYFLSQQDKKLTDVVISSEYFTADTVLHSNEQVIKNAAKLLRKNIFNKFNSFTTDDWPPDLDKLDSTELEPPESVVLFVESLLQPSGERTPNINRIANCLAQDIVYNVLQRKVPLKKQFLLGLGLHSLSGSRQIIDILFRFGNCVSYDYVCNVETAYVEAAQEKAKLGLLYPCSQFFESSLFSPTFGWTTSTF